MKSRIPFPLVVLGGFLFIALLFGSLITERESTKVVQESQAAPTIPELFPNFEMAELPRNYYDLSPTILGDTLSQGVYTVETQPAQLYAGGFTFPGRLFGTRATEDTFEVSYQFQENTPCNEGVTSVWVISTAPVGSLPPQLRFINGEFPVRTDTLHQAPYKDVTLYVTRAIVLRRDIHEVIIFSTAPGLVVWSITVEYECAPDLTGYVLHSPAPNRSDWTAEMLSPLGVPLAAPNLYRVVGGIPFVVTNWDAIESLSVPKEAQELWVLAVWDSSLSPQYFQGDGVTPYTQDIVISASGGTQTMGVIHLSLPADWQAPLYHSGISRIFGVTYK